jgi:WD40 repeat protein
LVYWTPPDTLVVRDPFAGVASSLGPRGFFGDYEFSPDGKVLAVSWSDDVRLFNLDSLQGISALRGHQASVTALEFSPGGSLLATGGMDGTARLWNITW